MSAKVLHHSLLLMMAASGLAAVWYATRPQPVKVRVDTVERGLVESIVANTRAGTVRACRRARIAPSVGGQIVVMKAREGQRVEARELLLAL